MTIRPFPKLCALVAAAAPATWVHAMEKLNAPGAENGILPSCTLVRDHASCDHHGMFAFMIQEGVRDPVISQLLLSRASSFIKSEASSFTIRSSSFLF